MKLNLVSHANGECWKAGSEDLCLDCEWFRYRAEGGRPIGSDAFILFLNTARAPEIRKLYAWLSEHDQAIPIRGASFKTMLRGIGFTRFKVSVVKRMIHVELVFHGKNHYFGQGETFMEAYDQAFGFFIKDVCGTLPPHLRSRRPFETEEL